MAGLRCKVCDSFPRPPAVSCANGCVFCNACVERYVQQRRASDSDLPPARHGEDDAPCPLCRRSLFPLREQLAIDTMLRDVPEECSHGCGAPGLLVSTVAAHEETCAARLIPCRYTAIGCSWVGTIVDELGHRQGCIYRVYNKCLLSMKQHQAQVAQQIEQSTAAVGRALQQVSVLRAAVGPGAVCTVRAALVRCSEVTWTATLSTPLATFALVLEQLSRNAADLGCALRICASGGAALPPKFAVTGRVRFTFSEQDAVCAIAALRFAFSSVAMALPVLVTGDPALHPSLSVRADFDQLAV